MSSKLQPVVIALSLVATAYTFYRSTVLVCFTIFFAKMMKNNSASAIDPSLEPTKKSVWSEDAPVKKNEHALPNKKIEAEMDIPTIPDLDDLQEFTEKDFVQSIVEHSKAASMYQELDSEFLKQQTVSLDDVDISPLLNQIYTNDIKEADVVWTAESLLNELIADE